MDDRPNAQIPLIAYEVVQAKNERTVKRLIVALIIAVVLMFASNALWLYAWTQYDYFAHDYDVISIDGKDGIANYIGNDGVINNGEDNNN